MNNTSRALQEELTYTEQDTLEVAGLWPDFVKWEETPFRPSDDVVLLSFGFHFGSDNTTLYKDDWRVDCSRAMPVWYFQGVRLGPKSYDDVVNLFGEKR